jgi:outer membrane protein OmpA-like peptidoglycan-associated protein
MKDRFFIKSVVPFLVLVACCFYQANGQNNPYIPQNLGPNINTEYAEINPVLSQDGKILFFNRLNHPDNYYGDDDSQDIWYSYLQPDGVFGKAIRLDVPFNKAKHNAIICAISNVSYLIEGVYTKGKTPRWRNRGLSIVTRNENDEWSKPKELKVKGYKRLNEGEASNVWMSHDGNVLIFSYHNHHNGKKNNLYVSLPKNGKWTKPQPLSAVINMPDASEETPFISYDNETLYFTSNFEANSKWEKSFNYNIYKTTRLDDSWRMWSVPTAISDTINSEEWDSYFRTNDKGTWAIFASSKHLFGQADIYKVKLFEDNPYVIVSGTVINKATNSPLDNTKHFTILADGLPIDPNQITIYPNSSSFTASLRLGKKYSIVADVSHYLGTPEEIDVANVKDYTTMKRDLFVESVPYVVISGNVMLENPRGIVPESSYPKIAINGTVVDSIKVNYPDGTYEVRLPFGKSYTLSVNAQKYVSVPAKVDLSEVKEYQEMKQDLLVKINPMATVSGRFYVSGTTTPIAGKYFPKLAINGVIIDSAMIDTAQASYKIALPLKSSYQLSVVANKYQGALSKLDLSTKNSSIDTIINLFGSFISTSAIVKGKVINRKNNLPLTGKTVAIQSNGQDNSGATFNSTTGEYQVELSLGSSYVLNASLAQHLPQYETVDLTKDLPNAKVSKDLYLTPIEVGQKVKLNNVFFETGKATLKPTSFPELDKVVKFLTENPSIKIQIEGHTDNVGKPDANLKLSRWRARSVQQYLVKKGIVLENVKYDGFGSTKPIAKNTTAQGRSLNRRVEFKILSIN